MIIFFSFKGQIINSQGSAGYRVEAILISFLRTWVCVIQPESRHMAGAGFDHEPWMPSSASQDVVRCGSVTHCYNYPYEIVLCLYQLTVRYVCITQMLHAHSVRTGMVLSH